MSWRSGNRELDEGPARGRRVKRERWLGAALSLAAHLSVLVALFLWVRPDEHKLFEPAAITVALVAEPIAAPAAAPKPAPTPPKPPTPIRRPPAKQPPPRRALARIVHAPLRADALPAGEARSEGVSSELSDAQLAGAASADSGGGGGACDMARRVQSALRKDRLVQAAVAQAHHAGKAIMVWNGDWVQSNGEDGKGLSAVREAIMWEVAFAPKACRAEPVRGLILLSLNTGPGAARLAVGSGEWRWSDLLR